MQWHSVMGADCVGCLGRKMSVGFKCCHCAPLPEARLSVLPCPPLHKVPECSVEKVEPRRRSRLIRGFSLCLLAKQQEHGMVSSEPCRCALLPWPRACSDSCSVPSSRAQPPTGATSLHPCHLPHPSCPTATIGPSSHPLQSPDGTLSLASLSCLTLGPEGGSGGLPLPTPIK